MSQWFCRALTFSSASVLSWPSVSPYSAPRKWFKKKKKSKEKRSTSMPYRHCNFHHNSNNNKEATRCVLPWRARLSSSSSDLCTSPAQRLVGQSSCLWTLPSRPPGQRHEERSMTGAQCTLADQTRGWNAHASQELFCFVCVRGGGVEVKVRVRFTHNGHRLQQVTWWKCYNSGACY